MKKLIGDRLFYKKILTIAVPIMIQSGITNFVNMLDNIMVGRVGTEQMTGVSIVTQLIFVFNLAIFGGMSGPGIFTSQYYGKNDQQGVRYTMRFKFIMGIVLSALFILVFRLFDEQLIGIYLTAEEGSVNIAETLRYGKDYLAVSIFGLLPFALTNVYATTLRETSDTMRPMLAGLAAVVVNLVFNYLLIYGKLGFPQLGVVGAALATVISRYVETVLLVFWTHRDKRRYPFIEGIFRGFRIPAMLVKKMVIKGAPLLINETMWAAGIAVLNQCYSLRGLDVVAGMNITMTLVNVFNVVCIALGSTIAILIGQRLGANQLDEARDEAPKMIAFSTACGLLIGGIMASLSSIFPQIYNTSDDVKHLAMIFILLFAIFQPINGIVNSIYYTLRSGGKTFITMLFDSMFVWAVQVPAALVIGNLTTMPIVGMLAAVNGIVLTKIVYGVILIKKGVWVNNIVAEMKL